ncbi:CoA transferase [Mycobacterium terramassiliense]|uniref:CoA transferase n=1 Tax=Mycobacterium terramassiliense TaxID=1841859 RepID=UPI000D3E0007
MNSGPLSGVRVVELAGIGIESTPHGPTLLGDGGANVVGVAGTQSGDPADSQLRNRALIPLYVKDSQEFSTLDLIAHSDVLIEGFRPGVAERLGGRRTRRMPGSQSCAGLCAA